MALTEAIVFVVEVLPSLVGEEVKSSGAGSSVLQRFKDEGGDCCRKIEKQTGSLLGPG